MKTFMGMKLLSALRKVKPGIKIGDKMKVKKEYVVLGKETYYYKTYVQANSEKEARKIATQNHTKVDIHEDENVQVCLIDEGGFYKAEYSYPLGESK